MDLKVPLSTCEIQDQEHNSKPCICEECEQYEAKFYCSKCEQNLCLKCDQQIHNRGARKNHQRSPLPSESSSLTYKEEIHPATASKSWSTDSSISFHTNPGHSQFYPKQTPTPSLQRIITFIYSYFFSVSINQM